LQTVSGGPLALLIQCISTGSFIPGSEAAASLTIKSRKIRWAGHVAPIGVRRGAFRVLVGKPEGKRRLGSSRLRWKDNNIKMDLQKVGFEVMD